MFRPWTWIRLTYSKVVTVCFLAALVCLHPSLYFQEVLPRLLRWQEYFQTRSEVEVEVTDSVEMEPQWNMFIPPKPDCEFEFDVAGARSEQVLNGLQLAQKAASQSRVVVVVDDYSVSEKSIEVYLIPPSQTGDVLKVTIHNLHVIHPRMQAGSVLAMQQ